MYKISTYLFILIGFGLLQAQIAITSTDILGLIGRSQVFETDTTDTVLNVNVGNPGANQIWDFSALETNAINFDVEYLAPANTPFAANFSTANFTQKMTFTFDTTTTESYQYSKVTPTQFGNLGEANTNPYTNITFIDTSYDSVPLPLQYQQTWQSVTRDTSELYPGYISVYIDSSDYVVDGWGTLKLATGTYGCLRLRENWHSVSIIRIEGAFFSSDTTFGISYIWLTKNNFSAAQVSSLDGETDPNFSTASSFQRLSSFVAIENPGGPHVARDFKLEQNYPNPFNPVTTIRFELNKSMPVTLDIYSLDGRHVAQLLNGTMSAGGHAVHFNAQSLSSGTYIYQIKTPEFTAMKKMLLIK